jgi:uncharacterized DUF497 family protein
VRCTWDARKAVANLQKHGVSFDIAAAVLRHPLSVTGADLGHSGREDRWITIGPAPDGRLIVVAHTEETDSLRVISARLATRNERLIYEEG